MTLQNKSDSFLTDFGINTANVILNSVKDLSDVDWKHRHDLAEPVLEISKSLLKLGSSFVFVGLFIGGIQLLKIGVRI